jgi:hypothetical protein
VFKRILSNVLFGVGFIWQMFVILGTFLNEITVQNLAISVLLSLVTAGILYISLKIRPPRPPKNERRPED